MMIRSYLYPLLLCVLLTMGSHALAEEPQHPDAMHSSVEPSEATQSAGCRSLLVRGASGFEGVQIETSDVTLYERFFDAIRVTLVRQFDHPGRDKLREYCYRDILIAVRQDLAVPRPTGWVQVNFVVADVAAIQQQLSHALESSPLAGLSDAERATIVRFRLKPDVMRGGCRVARFEVAGPEGFMIGFDQFKEGACRKAGAPGPGRSGADPLP